LKNIYIKYSLQPYEFVRLFINTDLLDKIYNIFKNKENNLKILRYKNGNFKGKNVKLVNKRLNLEKIKKVKIKIKIYLFSIRKISCFPHSFFSVS